MRSMVSASHGKGKYTALKTSWGFRFEDIKVPTWLWHGEKDSLIPARCVRPMAAAIPNCHATFYPDETHALFHKHRDEILATLAGADGAPTR